MFELIIAEKPQAAEKIAKALADTTPKKIRDGVNYFAITHKGKEIRVASAVGHLFILGEKGGESWKYPVFETEWKPIYKVNKSAGYTKDYIKLLEKLGKDANEITVAADFDIEGEVIGLNVVRYCCKKKDANRMKFSTLTKDALIKSYENKLKTLEWGQANAGETRHNLDWYYGINLSRAFTQSIKKASNQFKVLSTGRVQAPALHFLAERERKISAFESEDYNEIYLDGICQSTSITAQYELPTERIKLRKEILESRVEDEETSQTRKVSEGLGIVSKENSLKISVDKGKIFDKKFAQKVLEETTNKNGIISEISSKQFKQKVPTPFDLTSLQMEASTMLGYTPKRTLELAQKLYIEGVASYPRTSSQKLPKELDLKAILAKLEKFPNYRDKVAIVYKVNPKIEPNEGKKTDPAHPSIHPTGEIPKKLESQEQRLYDLIVKRFLAIFGKDAIRETNTIRIEIQKHDFVLKGTRTIEKNWHLLYEPYLKFEDVELPNLNQGELVENKKIEIFDKKTTHPKRYTDASIIKELEKRNLGTKATRAEILSNLKNRGYIDGRSIKVTELGMKMDDIISSDVPDLVDENLTRQFEENMEKIRDNSYTQEKTLSDAKSKLLGILKEVQANEMDLGKRLSDASHIARVEMARVGKCPNCEKGTLMIRVAKKSRQKFVGCDGYPDCKTIFNVPKVPVIKPIPNQPDEEGKIWIFAGKSEGNMKKVCINDSTLNDPEEKKYDEEGMVCPICNEGHMKLRKSFYGAFLGCDNYPNCKTMMKVVSGKVDITPIVTTAKKPTKKKTSVKKKLVKKKKE